MVYVKRFVATVIALLLLGFAVPVAAQQQKGASGLSISPTRVELSMKPGAADKIDITIKNVTSQKVIAQPFINDFESDNQSGNPKIIVDTSQKSSNSIRDFLAGLDDIPLAVGEQKKITVFVQIPSSLPPGGYFGLIRFLAVPEGTPKQTNGDVSLSASVSTLVLIEVPGNIKEQVQLKNVLVYQGSNNSILFTKKPDAVGVEVKNLGNTFEKPFGKVSIKNMSGKEIYSYEINNIVPRSNVLPNSTRIFKDSIKNIGGPGRYTVLASISYGKGSEVLIYKKAFWYVPLWMLIIIIAVIAALILAMIMLYRRYRGTPRVKRHRSRK
jgi:hypothetical protein